MTASAADVARTRAVAAFLARHDVRVVWFDGWADRGVDLPFGPPRAHLCHWDASTILSGEWGAIGIIIGGRGGANPVPGPLSQFQGGRCLDGVPKVGIVAAGRCNHGGAGGPFRLANGMVIPQDAANRWCSGSEWAWAGPAETQTPAARYAYDVLGAAVAEVYQVPVLHVISHEEWTEGQPVVRAPRKPDIGEHIHRVRRNAAAILSGDDDMFTDTDRDQLAAARGAAEAAYNKANSADAGVKALAVVVAQLAGGRYDVIRAADSPVVWAVVGDSRLHIPSQAALLAFGGPGAVEVVDPADPRLRLPVVQDEEPEPAPAVPAG